MKTISLLKAYSMVSKWPKLSEAERAKIQKQRLQELVMYAKNNSAYFNKLYNNINEDFVLSDLPPTNKVEMMKNFDSWVTDKEVRLDGINKFMENLDNIGRKYLGKYFVYTTSGSTGNPSVILYDKYASNVMAALSATRTFARKEDFKNFMKKGAKSIGVFATGGFYLGNSSVRSRLLAMPWKKRQFAVTSILNPIPEIVDELNKFQPAMLGGYPTGLEILMEQQIKGKLNVKPVLIMTGGEFLSDSLREQLSKAFGCFVQTSYSCTEGGTVAAECVHKHFHINDDWVIVEPVDDNYNPVPLGKQASKWLMTNLGNFTQPLIRFEITDRIVLHNEKCSCNNPSPWIELEGRTDEILSFSTDHGIVKIQPLAIYAIIKEIHDINRFQIVMRNGNELELRMVCKDELNNTEGRNKLFIEVKKVVNEFLAKNEITNVNWILTDTVPQRNPKSGKFKHIFMEK